MPRAPLPARLCGAYVALVGAEGGSISMDFAATDRMILCTTDDRGARIEDAQDLMREGPSLDAYRTGLAITGLSQAEQGRRWPMLSQSMESNFPGLSLHAFPIVPADHTVGAVLLYGAAPELTIATDAAQFLANAVGIALLGELGTTNLDDETWSDRDRVDQATGMVAVQLGVTPTDARAVLRAHAYAHDTSLAEVSSWVLARTLSFADPDASEGSAT